MSSDSPSFVVGLGGGGGALYALARLFKSMPADSGCAFVLYRTINEPGLSMCATMLRRATDMPVVLVDRPQPWRANTVYLTDHTSWLDASQRELIPVQMSGQFSRGPIDSLFASLARSWAERAVGIVLSGDGSDGASGALELVDAGALVLAQAPDAAELPAMPQAAIARGCVHAAVSPSELAGVICAYIAGCSGDQPLSHYPARYANLRQIQALHRRLQRSQAGPVAAQVAGADADDVDSQTAIRIAATSFEAQDAMLVLDSDGQVLRANAAFGDLFGVDTATLSNRAADFVFADIHDASWRRSMREALQGDGRWTGEVLCRRHDESVFPCWYRISVVPGLADGTSHQVALFTDISARKRDQERIRRLAYTDPLTELPNRRLILQRLEQRMQIRRRDKSYGALLSLDLDRFKALNETLGHEIGDRLLIQTSRRLRASVRGADMVGRVGGDEFLVVLDRLSATAPDAAGLAESIANNIRDSLEQPFDLDGMSIETGASIGICLFGAEQTSVDTLLRHADLALMQARRAGRHMIRFYNPVMQATVDARTVLDLSLRRAIAHGDLMLMYQPLIDRQGHLMGAEALIRWRDRERGLLLPGEFIDHAEATGLILPIGRWVLETACQQLSEWSRHPRTRHLKLSVNISPREFRQADFASFVREMLDESGVTPSLLQFELTENVLLEDPEDAIARMAEIRQLGVGIAIDDFGTGYSSLSYLKRLPVDQLKIDKSFVNDLVDNADDAAIVRAIIDMGRRMNLQVFAEGVETQAQYEFLERSGCDAFQGYLFGKPVAGTGALLAAGAV